MMEETYYLGTYWKTRREGVETCARRAELFFALLARCDPTLRQWYRSGRVTRRSPLPQVRTDDVENLKEHLLRGRHRADLDKSVMEEMGFTLSVWNKYPDASSTKIRICCGAYARFTSNVCLIEPPSEGEASERMLSLPMLEQLLECAAKAWDPDWGTVTTYQFSEALSQDDNEVQMGWLMYFARRWGTVPPLPAPVRIEPVGALGTLIVLSPERLSVSNPEQLALGQRIRELLDRAGLVKRPQAG
jgi:hypothetical protein